MPRIVPLQLLKCLKVLLDDNGGILSEGEVKRIAGLMTKYSKKLVSKCIYVQILKCTKTELLGEFMGAGGWTLVHMWLNDGIRAMNWPLVQEILELLLLCPVDVDRLKSNSAPKLVRGLCKDGGIEGVRILAKRLVEQWLKVVTTDTSLAAANAAVNAQSTAAAPTTTAALTPAAAMPPQATSIEAAQPSPIAAVAPIVSVPKRNAETTTIVKKALAAAYAVEEDPLADVPNDVPSVPSYAPTAAQKKASEAGLVYKIMLKDGQQVLTKVDAAKQTQSDAATPPSPTKSKAAEEEDEDADEEADEEDEAEAHEEVQQETDDEEQTEPIAESSSKDDVDACVVIDASEEVEDDEEEQEAPSITKPATAASTPVTEKKETSVKQVAAAEEVTEAFKVEETKEKTEKKMERKSSKDSRDGGKEKERKSDKDKEQKSSSSSHKNSSSSSSGHKSSSKSSTSSSSSKTKSSSSHRSSSDKHRSSDKERSSGSSSSKDKDRSSSSSSKHKSSSSSSSKPSSSSSSSSSSKERRDKDKLSTSSSRKDKDSSSSQADKDKETLANMAKQPSLDKLGKIPKKIKETAAIDAAEDSNSSNTNSAATNKQTSTSITIPSKKASMSIEIRRDSEKAKTVKTYKSQFRSHGLTEEAPPPPSRKGLKKPLSASTPGTTIPLSLPSAMKRSSPPPSRDSPTETTTKKPKFDINHVGKATGMEDKPGAIKLIAPKKIATLVETNIFSDALSAATGPKKAAKRKRPNGKEAAASPPTSPETPKVAPLKFYQDTLDESKEEDRSAAAAADSQKSEESTSGESGATTKEDAADASADKENSAIEDDDDIPLKKVKEDIEQKVRKEQNKTEKQASIDITSDTDDETNKAKSSPKDDTKAADAATEIAEPEEPKKPGPGCGPNGPPGVLMLHRRKGPKKKLCWRPQEQLEQIRYFELDETERVNVHKNFMDMKNMERFSERDALNMSRRGFNHEDNMEPRTLWRPLQLLDDVPPHPDGNQSKERKVQADREQTTLRALYFSHSMIPDSPTEAELEPHYAHDIPVIPLDDITGNPDAVNDFTSMPWPEPRGSPRPGDNVTSGLDGLGGVSNSNPFNPFINSFVAANNAAAAAAAAAALSPQQQTPMPVGPPGMWQGPNGARMPPNPGMVMPPGHMMAPPGGAFNTDMPGSPRMNMGPNGPMGPMNGPGPGPMGPMNGPGGGPMGPMNGPPPFMGGRNQFGPGHGPGGPGPNQFGPGGGGPYPPPGFNNGPNFGPMGPGGPMPPGAMMNGGMGPGGPHNGPGPMMNGPPRGGNNRNNGGGNWRGGGGGGGGNFSDNNSGGGGNWRPAGSGQNRNDWGNGGNNNNGGGGGNNNNGICKAFMRGHCRVGKSCKYVHPKNNKRI